MIAVEIDFTEEFLAFSKKAFGFREVEPVLLKLNTKSFPEKGIEGQRRSLRFIKESLRDGKSVYLIRRFICSYYGNDYDFRQDEASIHLGAC